jgi:hypothetical protein
MVFLQNQGLPTQRARLYKDCINILLYRWTHARSNQQTILDIIEAVSLDDRNYSGQGSKQTNHVSIE